MIDGAIKFIGREEILSIVPLLKLLNSKIPEDLLNEGNVSILWFPHITKNLREDAPFY